MTDITLLDGAIGQELVARAPGPPTPLWSTQVMIDRPETVTEVHRDYLSAGATVITTNTYAIHRSRLERRGLEGRLSGLIGTAIDAAETARAQMPGVRIAGCLGPVLASYRPDLQPDLALSEARFSEIAEIMRQRVDVLLLETVSSLLEAEGALRGVQGSGVPIWIAFSVDDEDGTRLRSGERVADCLPLIEGRVQAVLINCSRPEAVSRALPIIAQSGVPYGGYANGFREITSAFKTDFPTVEALQARSDLDPARYAEFALRWVDDGATMIGGCCETGPAHIREIAKRLRAAGHDIV